MTSLAAKFPVSRLKRYHREAALRAVGNWVRHDDQVSPVPLPKLGRVLPGIVLWPVPFFPEVRQHIEQKNDAQAI